MKIDLVKQLISEFENSEVFKMKVEMEDVKLELEKAPVAPVNRNSFNCETLFLWIQKSCENSYQRFEREQNTPGRRDTFACAWCSLFHWKYFIFPDC